MPRLVSLRVTLAVAAAIVVGLAPAPARAQALPPLDHFWCYGIADQSPNAQVRLRDQFDVAGAAGQPFVVRNPLRFCNPVEKTTAAGAVFPINDPGGHLKLYLIPPSHVEPVRTVKVRNQFGRTQTLNTFDPLLLAVPSQKNDEPPPADHLDHFKCYRAYGRAPLNRVVRLRDQFQQATVTIQRPVLHCNPVEKLHGTIVTPIKRPAEHLVCYYVTRASLPNDRPFLARNQFGVEELSTTTADILCVPSRKLGFTTAP
jgi:hypothetical protein